ncbi:hypothetical protein CLAIMM_02009 [Cladophialophora immunda]|nr:hypothetical protein CLAIMM_02009 [Cladophialophora immunda]
MKVTSNERHIHAALAALNTYVLPELESTTSKESASLIRVVLEDVLKRTSGGIHVLKTVINDGKHLVDELCHTFPDVCSPPVSTTDETEVRDFDSLSQTHGILIKELDLMCARLSERKADDVRAGALLRKAAEWEFEYLDKLRNLDSHPPPSNGMVNGISKSKVPTVRKTLTRELLEDWLVSQRGRPLRVTQFSAVAGGYSNQTYFCTIAMDGAEDEELVIRKSIPTVIAPFLDLDEEFKLLQILESQGFPSPIPKEIAFKLDFVDDTFYTMKRLRGRPPGTLFMGDDQVIPPELLRNMADVLARLHNITLEKFAGFYKSRGAGDISHESVESCYKRRLRELRRHLEMHEHLPSLSITWLFHWLENHVPACSDMAVMTHGDFDLRNILVDDQNQITGVVDWETADLGAPEDDLAYLRAHLPASVDWSIFLDRYYSQGGRQIRRDYIQFCQVWGVLRMQVAMNRKVYDLQTGHSSDILYFHIQSRFAPGMLEIGLRTVPAEQ